MSIRDRGRIKWTAMMLPEHVKELRDMWEQFEREEKPINDLFTISENEERINYAMEYNLAIMFKVWRDLPGRCEEFTGRVHYINPSDKKLWIECEDGSFERVGFQDVVTVNVID
ncbi:YolD-like family protein [Rossellomorea marisflavi]|uniref:YolD-like family protein n=1 Tax=Rossellomorea marisflavi TaxID=189381 RepID=A0A5D4S031_9BACI|nr:YolD-like family protein [Rossellomorea marisflavi]TYS57005.1 YolD-like family protein [Rossellomorea marisflavi]